MHREVVKLEYRIMELEQQRAELMEALKVAEQYVQVYVGNSFFGANSKSDLAKIKEAITKAEAAE